MKKIIILLIILCIIFAIGIATTIIVLSLKNEDSNNNNEISNNKTEKQENIDDDYKEQVFLDKEINKVDNINEYCRAEACLKKFITYLKVNNQTAIYSISDGQPIFNIEELSQQMKIQEIYSVDNDNGTTFFVNVKLANSKYYIIIINDFANSTFKISTLTEQEYNSIIQAQSTTNYTTYLEVPKNEYNDIKYITLNNENTAKKYFDSYIQNARYYPEDAYNSLDEEYRNARFGSYENYLNYLSNKGKELESLDPNSIKDIREFATEEEYTNYINNLQQKSMSKYYFDTIDNEKYCICTDPYNNYYIFKIESAMNYKLILDTYTIDLPEFIEKYNKADTMGKVKLNINKIFEAINEKDYNYVYNKLDIEYKTTNFSNYETFEIVMENNFFEQNNVELNEYIEEENVYKYSLTITDASGNDTNKKLITVIMQLGENTDFTVKFE